MTLEYCYKCNSPTGRAGRGEDSLYTDSGEGPHCKDCWDKLDLWNGLQDSLVRSTNRIEKLEKTLDDIAKGVVPAGEVPSLEDKHEFRYKMWQWSQKRAREGLES